ncbi:pilus assembly protein TadC [Gemmobacter lanyuensis]|uniref:Pilus assembly protein TadC n=1 Tax=Gemmobacter lanyuensis TaxID=1054497 RepID=A0A918IR80_9RHOB|nr:type II secretion system F family protein [Gemmobacter lanyuensis]GGW24247.1 pilus assembly protein TadC [Gemmobacter lanyuensis]
MLTNINALLTEKLGPLGPVMVLLGLAVVLVAVALPTILQKRTDPLDKLKQQRTAMGIAAGDAQLRTRSAADKLEKYAAYLEPQDQQEMSAARLTMLRAGYRSKNAVRTYYFAKLTLGLGALALGLLYTMLLKSQRGDLPTQTMILYTILPAAAGYYMPQYWVQRRLQTRQAEILAGFADALDLMLVCVEAGQSLDQSINRVAQEMRAGYPALAEEFEMVAQEVKAGKERVQVLKDMSERVGVADVSSFVTTLVQSATFGTSISEALRVYSAEMRDKRVMRAEEKANVLPTKLTLGTMMFTLPPLMLILIGPSIYGIATQLGGG